jgi:xanthine dehydrogenase accessory factor
MNQADLYAEIERELRSGRPVAQATVIQTRGSTPRKEGSTMLVRQDGTLFGTIGGGCGEAGVIQKAKLTLLDGRHREELADLTEDISLESEAVCGGTLRVFIEPWHPDPAAIGLAAELKALAAAGRPVVVHQVVKCAPEADAMGRRIVQALGGERVLSNAGPAIPVPMAPERKPTQLVQSGGFEIFTQRWDPTPALVIIGAGHIAEPLEALGRLAGFATTVVDDRRLFANRQRFPHAAEVLCAPILEAVRKLPLTPHTYVVLVTRGHVLDMDALKVLIERNEQVAYVGMIGSARRVRAVFELLEAQGFTRDRFRHVHAPIGLSIGAETPAEIAVSIMAEMIAVRRRAGEDTRPMAALAGIHPALRRVVQGGA